MTERIIERLARIFAADTAEPALPAMLGKQRFLELAGRVMVWRGLLKLPPLSQEQRILLAPLGQFPVQQFLQALLTLLQEFPELGRGLTSLWAAQMQDRDLMLATILRIAESIRARTLGRRRLCIDGLVRTTEAIDEAAAEALADPTLPREERDAILPMRRSIAANEKARARQQGRRRGRGRKRKGA